MRRGERRTMDTGAYYDKLVDDGNDPFRDPQPLKDYMDKWDGRLFIEAMKLGRTKSVLEIGVGTGRLAARVAPHCRRLCGIDISPKTIRRARENLAGFPNITLICADFLDYFFEEAFDVVYSSLTMMHFADKRRFICKAGELLRPNGIFCLSIDKSSSDHIDMGAYKIRIYPDRPDDTEEYIRMSDMKISSRAETGFAHIFICSK